MKPLNALETDAELKKLPADIVPPKVRHVACLSAPLTCTRLSVAARPQGDGAQLHAPNGEQATDSAPKRNACDVLWMGSRDWQASDVISGKSLTGYGRCTEAGNGAKRCRYKVGRGRVRARVPRGPGDDRHDEYPKCRRRLRRSRNVRYMPHIHTYIHQWARLMDSKVKWTEVERERER